MSAISPKLQDLLVREAHFRLCREQLAPALAEKEIEYRRLQGSRPTMFMFSPKGVRDVHETKLTEARETVRVLKAGLEQLDRVEPHLCKLIHDEIEDLLRTSCPEYTSALAARGQKEDWRRCLERFAERVFDLLQALGSARNMACSGYAGNAQGYSQSAVQALVVAIGAAEKVESEVRFANQIAEAQVKILAESGFADAQRLPRLREVSYAVWVSTISSRSLSEAQIQFESLIADVKKLYESGIPHLSTQAEAADQGQGSLIANFLTEAWAQLRDEIAPLVKPDDTERSVADTEIMVVSLARQTALGRLTGAGDPGAAPTA